MLEKWSVKSGQVNHNIDQYKSVLLNIEIKDCEGKENFQVLAHFAEFGTS